MCKILDSIPTFRRGSLNTHLCEHSTTTSGVVLQERHPRYNHTRTTQHPQSDCLRKWVPSGYSYLDVLKAQ
ncbi:hypothetical protein THAOC_12842 [Thalassiosira oceanica]|uniref:Uncharacterized protein n=1 Tax=Thalassiosira oceanica TaxID=159749 RepID=K0SJ71_THAOC|nr:hypothetical protein THAOC_12842 [Thalassiosira oceanica]|eukprot:EJK66253.1 hypothetical protein THAOC_12842 [Thalassiosira oceanica]